MIEKNVLQPKVLEIISEFINADDGNYRLLQNNLSSYKNIFQCVYSNVFPEIAQPKKEVLTSKVIFTLYLKPKKGGGGEWGKWGKTQEIMSL